MRRILESKRPIGALLMDQALVAGVGNVYRAELLHRLRLDPYLPGTALTEGVVQRIWEELVRLMPYGVETGRILVDDGDIRRAAKLMREGKSGRIRPTYAVYRRHGKACPRCGATVQKATMVARNLYWCPGCQGGLPDLSDPAVDKLLAEEIVSLVAARPAGSVCPSEVARKTPRISGRRGGETSCRSCAALRCHWHKKGRSSCAGATSRSTPPTSEPARSGWPRPRGDVKVARNG